MVNIFQDRAGEIWLSTLGGLNRFDPQTHTFVRYVHDPRNPTSLSDDYVTMTYEDRAGRFWVVTNNGLNLMDRARGTFSRYMRNSNDSSSLSSLAGYQARSFVEDESGTLWVSSSGRLSRVDRTLGTSSTYSAGANDSASIGETNVRSVGLDATAGMLWVGTDDSGVRVLDRLERWESQPGFSLIGEGLNSEPSKPLRSSNGLRRLSRASLVNRSLLQAARERRSGTR